MVLSRNEIEIVTNHYARQYEVKDWLVNLEEIVDQHRQDHFYIYRKLCQIKDWLIVFNKEKKFTTKIRSRK